MYVPQQDLDFSTLTLGRFAVADVELNGKMFGTAVGKSFRGARLNPKTD